VKGDEFIDRLRIVTVDDKKTFAKWETTCSKCHPAPGAIDATEYSVRQDTIEKSNVNAVIHSAR